MCELIFSVTNDLLNYTVICGHVFDPIIAFMGQIVVLISLQNKNLALVQSDTTINLAKSYLLFFYKTTAK